MGLKQDGILLLKRIPHGKVTTYKEIAHALHSKAYRAVGSAMRCNEHPDVFPCFKVVNGDGSVGNYSGPGGVSGKIKRLAKEGIVVKNGKIAEFEKRLWKF